MRVPWIGALVLAGLAGLLVLQHRGELRIPPAGGPGGAATDNGSGATDAPGERASAFSLAPRERFAVVGERPLFMPTRRPPDPPPPPQPLRATAPPPPPPPALPLLTVKAIVRDGDRWVAVLSPGDRAPPEQAEPGSTVFGWTVTAIHPHAVELRSGARTARIELRPGEPPARP